MTIKKRFYIEIYNGWGKLRDRSSSASEFVTGYPLSDRPGMQSLKELCDLLNKGWEAEVFRSALAEIANWCTIERNCDDADIAASSMQTIAREALEATEEER